MESNIISLTCPKCGSPNQHIDQDIRYGYEFTCEHCGGSSVLIINNRLYMPLPGERVCTTCGRVAERNSRFCQCGKPLVRKCINQECLKEFPVDHVICDFCGWRQDVIPSSVEGARHKFLQMVQEFNDPDIKVRNRARTYVEDFVRSCNNVSLISFATNELISNQINVGPFLLDLLSHDIGKDEIDYILTVLKDLQVDIVFFEKTIILYFDSAEKVKKAFGIIDVSGESAFAIFSECLANSVSEDYFHKLFVTFFVWVFQNKNGIRYSDQFLPICVKYFSKPINENYTLPIVQLGPQIVPFLVRVMEELENSTIRGNCVRIFLQIGHPVITKLQQAIKDPQTSKYCKEWLNSAIRKINARELGLNV